MADANAVAEKEHIAKETMVDVEESDSQHIADKEGFDEEGGGGKEDSTPFRITKHHKEMTSGPRKKHKSDKHAHVDLMVLTKGNLDEIRDKFCDTMTTFWMQFEHLYKQELGNMQKDLRELQIQMGRLQESGGQASEIQARL